MHHLLELTSEKIHMLRRFLEILVFLWDCFVYAAPCRNCGRVSDGKHFRAEVS